MKRILVTGASGFIGHNLVKQLKKDGNWVRGADWRRPEYGCEVDEFILTDLREKENCLRATKDIEDVYAFAADMGGMGFIQDPKNRYLILYNNTLINFHTLESARANGARKYLYTSSACIYPEYLQDKNNIAPLKEKDAYPAQPQDSYGWEKLQAEHLCLLAEGIETRIVRFHNIYGPEGTWKGGREKAPAALCRKVIQAIKNNDTYIEIWGDGEQTRSFCYIEDCLKGIKLVMNGQYNRPVNLGRDEMVSINSLAKIIMNIADVDFKISHVDGPEGVRGRNSDNTLFKEIYGWAPEIDLKTGLENTYKWIKSQMDKSS